MIWLQFSLVTIETNPWFRSQQSNGKLEEEKNIPRWFASSIKGCGDTYCLWRTQAVSPELITTITQRHSSVRFFTEIKTHLLSEPRFKLYRNFYFIIIIIFFIENNWNNNLGFMWLRQYHCPLLFNRFFSVSNFN